MASDTRKVSRNSQKTGRFGARRLLGPTVVLTALVVWVLVGWRELYPPVSIVSARAGQVKDMVRCPGGTLWTLTPQRSYEVASFYLDRFEVTRAEYEEFLRAHPQRVRPLNLQVDGGRSIVDPELPVTWVTWNDAQAYARWVGKRLPTSIEWELAARGPRNLRYPWGSYGQEWVANTADLRLGRPTPVGLFEDGRSTLGLYDMVGNVAEWTATAAGANIKDRYFVRGGSFRDSIFGANRTDFLAIYGHQEEREEEHPDALTSSRWVPHDRFLRGPSHSSGDLGFRCALDADPDLIWAQIARLGYRDPVGFLMQVRPATRELESIGEPSLPLLTQAASALDAGTVKQRLLDLIARIRGGSQVMGRAPVTRKAIDETLARAGLARVAAWGQNFLIGLPHLDRIADLADVAAGETVLEVGPGLGGLTERLLERGARVVAAEIDPGYCRLLPELLDDPSGLLVVPGDVMQSKSALAPGILAAVRQTSAEAGSSGWKIVSNLPYQISSPFLAGLVLLQPLDWTRAVLTLQKEVAEVVRADPGSSAYSPLSFLTGLYLQVTRGPRLGRDCFHPRPEVESEVVVLEPDLAGRVPPAELAPFVRRLFQGRRKALRGTVLPAFQAAGVDLPREVEPEELLRTVGILAGDRVDGVSREFLQELYREGRKRGRMPAAGRDGGGAC